MKLDLDLDLPIYRHKGMLKSERRGGKEGREFLCTSYDVLLHQIKVLNHKSIVWSNFRAKPLPPTIWKRGAVRKKKGSAGCYLYSQRTTEAGFIKRQLRLMSVNRSGRRNAPATVKTLTVAGSLRCPLRLIWLTIAGFLWCPLRLTIYRSGRSCGRAYTRAVE